jgi:hypothetical protein
MFFKKKIPVQDYCRLNLEVLFSDERVSAFEELRQSTADDSIITADRNLYIDNLRAIFIQLMQVGIVKNTSLAVSADAFVFVKDFLQQRSLDRINSLTSLYNKAFAARAEDGVAGMVEVFLEQVCGNSNKPDLAQLFHGEFYEILKGMLEDYKSLKLTPTR